MCTLWFVFSIVLTLGFIFFRFIFGRVGFSTILFIGTAIDMFLVIWRYVHFSPLLFDSLEEGGVNSVNGGRGTDLLLHYIFSFSPWRKVSSVLNVPWKFSFIKSIQFPRRPSEMCNSHKVAHYLNVLKTPPPFVAKTVPSYWFSYLPRPKALWTMCFNENQCKIVIKLLSH